VAADPGVDAPTVAIPLAAPVDPPTAPYGTPVVAAVSGAVAPAAAPAQVSGVVAPAAGSAPVSGEAAAQGPAAVTGPVSGEDAAQGPAGAPVPEPGPAPAVPAPRAAVRAPAVFDPAARRGARPRSLPRLLVGAGAVVVAALVVVALFRADGPLDPPTEPVVGADAPRLTGAPVVPLPTTVAPVPAAEGVRMEEAHAAARPVDLPVDAAPPSVDTTSPTAPDVRTTEARPDTSRPVARAEAPPVGAAPRTPPTPAEPVL
jgi:hypothetical protein